MSLPVLRGERVTLREWRLDDADSVRAAASDPLIPLITTVPADPTDEAVASFVERQWSRPGLGHGWPFAIALDDVCVGACGVFFKDASTGQASLGYWVLPAARRQGIAADAVATILPWAFEQPEVGTVEASVEPWNTGSIRVLETAGFTRVGDTTETVAGLPRPMLLYSRPAEL